MKTPQRLVCLTSLFIVLAALSFAPSVKIPEANAASWTLVNSNGFGDRGATYSAPTLFNNNIYVAVSKESGGRYLTEIWRSSTGTNNSWTKVVANGLTGQLNSPNNTGDVYSFYVSSDNWLYLTNNPNWSDGDCSQANSCRLLWKSNDGQTWIKASPNNFETVSQSAQEKTATTTNDIRSGKIVSSINFQNKIFVATAKHDIVSRDPNSTSCDKGEVFKSTTSSPDDNPSSWEPAWDTTQTSGIGDSFTCAITGLVEYKGQLYVSTAKSSSIGRYSQILKTSDGVTWTDTLPLGLFDNRPLITKLAVLSSSYGDELFAAADFNLESGEPAALYRTLDGKNWSKVTGSDNVSAGGNSRVTSLAISGDELFVGVQNNSGAQLWRTAAGGPQWDNLTAGSPGFGSNTNTQVGGVLSYNNYIYVTAWNQSAQRGVKIYRTQLVPAPEPQCSLDVAIVLDLSGSMDQIMVGGNRTKIQAAVEAVNNVLDIIARPHNGSRVALLTFNALGGVNVAQNVNIISRFRSTRLSTDWDFFDPNDTSQSQSNLTIMKTIVTGLLNKADGGTPIAHAIGGTNGGNGLIQMFQDGRSSPRQPPVVLLVGDGAATIDLHRHVFDNEHTDAVSIRDTRSPDAFWPEPVVREMGQFYPNHARPSANFNEYAGAVLADVMLKGQALVSQISNLKIFSIPLQPRGGGNFNVSTMQYLGSLTGGTRYNSFNTYVNITNYQGLEEAFQNAIVFESCKSFVSLQLPPRLLIKPKQIYFGGNTYTIQYTGNGDANADNCIGPRCNAFAVEIARKYQFNSSDTRGEYYQIIIRKFRRGFGTDWPSDPKALYGLKISFDPLIRSADITTVADYLNDGANNPDSQYATAFIGDNSCSPRTGGSSICLRTILKADVPDINDETPMYLTQRIERKGLIVGGNVAAPQNIRGFTLDSNSIAVGGNVTVAGDSPKLQNYIDQQRTVFSWDQISDKVTTKVELARLIGSEISSPGNFSGNTYNGNSWNLNSASRNPKESPTNSFSTPPEGKIWYWGSSLTLGAASTHFSGTGTVVVKNNLDINGEITCDENKTRLTFLVGGRININTKAIGCGAYIASGGDLTLRNESDGNIKGIFVARGNVKLPDPGHLSGAYFIRYDSYLGSNPTALIKELLALIFSASS